MNDKSFQLGFFSSSRFDNSHKNDLLYSTCKGAYISIGGFRANLDNFTKFMECVLLGA